MSESHSNEVQVLRQQAAAGTRTAAVKGTGRTRRAAQEQRREPRRAARAVQDVVDLTADDDDDVEITGVKNVKRRRAGQASPNAAAALALQLAAPAAAQPPPAPPSPKGYKCIICLERMASNMATTTCGHMFCYKCISEWVAKSGNCPQCRSKLSKSKIIRVYPPTD